MIDDNPKLTVLCTTYNHGAYIRQALESFVSQKTDFKFEVVIGDDGSTDGTSEICHEFAEKYPDIIFHFVRDRRISLTYKFLAQYNSIESWKSCRGKYISFCNGDDCFEHPYVLQKQVDFLDAHPDYGLVHGGASYYFEENQQLSPYVKGRPGIPEGNIYNDLFSGNFIKSCGVCFRIEILRIMQEMIQSITKWVTFDHMYWIEACARGYKIGYIDEPLSIYRIHRQSTMHSDQISKDIGNAKLKYKIRYYFLQKYGAPYTHDELLVFYLRNARQIALNYRKPRLAARYERFLNQALRKVYEKNEMMFQADDAFWF